MFSTLLVLSQDPVMIWHQFAHFDRIFLGALLRYVPTKPEPPSVLVLNPLYLMEKIRASM